MVRTCLIASLISLIAGLTPASAQGGGGCEQWCRANRCSAAGGIGYAAGGLQCMTKCVATCKEKMSKHK
jgi:hypothetical protein